MIVDRFFVAGAIKFPLGTWRSGIRIGGNIRIARSADVGLAWLLHRFWLHRLGDFSRVGARGTHLPVELIVAHHVAESKKYAGEQQHQKEQPDDVPPLEYAFPRAGSLARSHAYFLIPPKLSTQLLIISIGRGNTIVVFFSTPISVNVCR